MKIKLTKIKPPKREDLDDLLDAIRPEMEANVQRRRAEEAARHTQKNVIRFEAFKAQRAARGAM